MNSYSVSLVKIDTLSLESVKEETWDTGYKNSGLFGKVSLFLLFPKLEGKSKLRKANLFREIHS